MSVCLRERERERERSSRKKIGLTMEVQLQSTMGDSGLALSISARGEAQLFGLVKKKFASKSTDNVYWMFFSLSYTVKLGYNEH